MRAHCIMNIPFEGPGYISDWMVQRGVSMRIWKLYENPAVPRAEDVDLLVVMGGPMNIYEEDKYPYLVGEKELIKACIRQHKKVLGICLGAQLIADALDRKVFRNNEKEIGWFQLVLEKDARGNEILSAFPETIIPFHWHGETFDLPEGAALLGSSEACQNQGFIYEDHVLALQFHLEITAQIIEGLLAHVSDELTKDPYVNSIQEIRKGLEHCPANREILFHTLDKFLADKK